MNIKKILFGTNADKNDPKFQKIHEDSKKAGRKVTEITGLGKFVGKVQRFAESHQKVFFTLIFIYIFFASIIAIQRVNYLWHNRPVNSSAVERQERELQMKRHYAPGGSENGNNNKDIYYEGAEGAN